MSTKIYNGFELKGVTLESAFALIKRFQSETIQPLVLSLVAQHLSSAATACFDRAHLGWEPLSGSPLAMAARDLRMRQAEVRRTNQRDPAVDFSFDLVLIPHQGRVFGMPFVEQPQFRVAWTALPEVRPFGYWDNSDPEDGVTQAAWAERERIWAEIFAVAQSPAEAGFSFSVSSVDTPAVTPDAALIARYIPSLEDRAEELLAEFFDRENAASGLKDVNYRAIREQIKREKPAALAKLHTLLLPTVSIEGLWPAIAQEKGPEPRSSRPR